ncbi:MAG: hypothetical protein ACYS0D_14145 [Planctomycetota bacterium]
MTANQADLDFARELTRSYVDRTGVLSGVATARRYLWTDAFAVCNLIALTREAGDADARHLAASLVDQVHHVLGRHRPDDARRGWISGLGDGDGEQHPTTGGLRIGKPLPERRPDEPCDAGEEWERDGQYFHYLVKWMHALNRMTLLTGNAKYNTWAIELAKAASAGFVHRDSLHPPKRMYWKMSIDLGHPLVLSMGQHDPLEGLITYSRLAASGGAVAADDLGDEISDMFDMCRRLPWKTDDPLGIGGLLCAACELMQLIAGGKALWTDLLEAALDDAVHGLRAYRDEQAAECGADRPDPPDQQRALRPDR